MNIDRAQMRWFRLRRSGLVSPFPTTVHAAKALVGVQAQILPAAGLALFNRCPLVTEALLDELLHRDRSLVRIWGQRLTLHLFASEDWPLIIGSVSSRLSRWEASAAPFGMTRKRYRHALAEVEQLLKEKESLGRRGLAGSGFSLPDACFSGWGGIYGDLVLRGLACHVSSEGGEGRYAHRHNWLPGLEWSPPSWEEASLELVRRYAQTYGPIAPKDLAWWLGAKVTDVRRWLGELDEELTAVECEGQELLIRRDDLTAVSELPPAQGHWPLTMLYRFDPLLLGYSDRSWLIDEPYRPLVSRPAGHIEGVVLDTRDGRTCATWRYSREVSGVIIKVAPFRPLSPALKKGIKARSAAIADYFASPLKGIVYGRPEGQ